MTTLLYETRGVFFSSGGSSVVLQDDEEIATVELEPGNLSRGPRWTWRGAFGAEWTLESLRSDREYTVVHPDGSGVGRLTRALMSSSMTLTTSEGTAWSVSARRMFSREQSVDLGDGRLATVGRETSAWTWSSREQWRLELPDPIAEPLRTLLLALPLALDHHHRRQQASPS